MSTTLYCNYKSILYYISYYLSRNIKHFIFQTCETLKISKYEIDILKKQSIIASNSSFVYTYSIPMFYNSPGITISLFCLRDTFENKSIGCFQLRNIVHLSQPFGLIKPSRTKLNFKTMCILTSHWYWYLVKYLGRILIIPTGCLNDFQQDNAMDKMNTTGLTQSVP